MVTDDPDRDGVGDVDLQAVATLLDEVGFDEDQTLLTRRQAEILVLRERGHRQADIAAALDTTRENVTGIERRARENVEKARATVEFSDYLSAPVRVEVPAGTDLYDAPDLVFEACDDADITVTHNAPELMKLISDGAGGAVEGRQIRRPISVSVTSDGTVRVTKP